jgi:hypothetical protein
MPGESTLLDSVLFGGNCLSTSALYVLNCNPVQRYHTGKQAMDWNTDPGRLRLYLCITLGYKSLSKHYKSQTFGRQATSPLTQLT